MSPRVTVIIPTYNWSSVLPTSIGSVLRQSFTDFELLVVGDGCTDASEAVVGGFSDARVAWINLPVNAGHQSAPNNEGLRRARGDLIAYLGHDDLWLPHHLAVLVPALAAEADVAYGLTAMVDATSGRIDPAPTRPEPWRPSLWIPPTGLVHRRSTALAVGGWQHIREVSVDPEQDLCQRMASVGARFVFVPRLTAIKFPASLRRDVYRTRPNHEQAAWFHRIETESDLEAQLLARILVGSERFATREIRRRVWRAFKRRLMRAPGYRHGLFLRRRRFKGLGDLP